MNLLTLYYFVELARELHVTNTAQKLYISQQNLSQHIQRLEQHYGVSLFHRKPKLALTYEGEQLYAVAVKILAEEHEFMNRLADISAEKASRPPLQSLPGVRNPKTTYGHPSSLDYYRDSPAENEAFHTSPWQ